MSILLNSLTTTPLLAQAGDQNYAPSWALVVFLVAFGVALALLPTKRTTEIKRSRDH